MAAIDEAQVAQRSGMRRNRLEISVCTQGRTHAYLQRNHAPVTHPMRGAAVISTLLSIGLAKSIVRNISQTKWSVEPGTLGEQKKNIMPTDLLTFERRTIKGAYFHRGRDTFTRFVAVLSFGHRYKVTRKNPHTSIM